MKKVTIVGVGALGSHVALFMRSMEAQIRLVDFDRVETKNTLSQFHGKGTVGKNKALALSATMSFLFGVKPEAIPHELTQANQIQLLGGSDLIIDCLDNAPARKILQDYVRQKDIPCLHGGLAADGSLGRVVWDHLFFIDDAGVAGATCQDGRFLPFIGMVSALTARTAQKFIEYGEQMNWQVMPSGLTIRL